MKALKKLLAVAVSLVMVVGMMGTAMAYEISVPDADSHTYAVYQIFTGTLANDGSLTNVKWGKNGTGTEGESVDKNVLEALQAVNVAVKTDKEKLAVIEQYASLTNQYGTVSKGSALTDVPAGYYLLKDNSTLTEDDAYTTYIVQVVDDVEIARKAAKPSVDKQVQDEAGDKDTDSTDSQGWGETADHSINETFKFKLTATMPTDPDLDDYETYKLVFNDSLSKGITYEGNMSVEVKWSDGNTTTLTTPDDYSTNASEYSAENGTTLTVTISDLKAIATREKKTSIQGAVVTVIYDAHLNENAVIGNDDDNQNKVNLKYSNNPNSGGTGDMGKTPDDYVFVFTYEMDNTKYSEKVEAGEELAGAGFRLYSDASCTTEVGLIYDNTLSAYRPVKAGETAVEMVSSSATATKGQFNIKGLDAGTYYLKETTTPSGYNDCDVITVVIQASHKETSDTTATTNITMTKDGDAAEEIDIINNKGSTLPETGGMGTTLFYIVGGVLMVGAAVLLITKKRMQGRE